MKRGSVAITVPAVAGDGDDVFIWLQWKNFFFAGSKRGCCAPVGPHVAIPEKK